MSFQAKTFRGVDEDTDSEGRGTWSTQTSPPSQYSSNCSVIVNSPQQLRSAIPVPEKLHCSHGDCRPEDSSSAATAKLQLTLHPRNDSHLSESGRSNEMNSRQPPGGLRHVAASSKVSDEREQPKVESNSSNIKLSLQSDKLRRWGSLRTPRQTIKKDEPNCSPTFHLSTNHEEEYVTPNRAPVALSSSNHASATMKSSLVRRYSYRQLPTTSTVPNFTTTPSRSLFQRILANLGLQKAPVEGEASSGERKFLPKRHASFRLPRTRDPNTLMCEQNSGLRMVTTAHYLPSLDESPSRNNSAAADKTNGIHPSPTVAQPEKKLKRSLFSFRGHLPGEHSHDKMSSRVLRNGMDLDTTLTKDVSGPVRHAQPFMFPMDLFACHGNELLEHISWTQSQIRKPLLKSNEKAMRRHSHELFKLIQQYMGDRESRHALRDLALSIAQRGLKHVALRDELYMQLCKQTNSNPSVRSTCAGLTLLCICLSFFPPSPVLRPHLEHYLLHHVKLPDVDSSSTTSPPALVDRFIPAHGRHPSMTSCPGAVPLPQQSPSNSYSFWEDNSDLHNNTRSSYNESDTMSDTSSAFSFSSHTEYSSNSSVIQQSSSSIVNTTKASINQEHPLGSSSMPHTCTDVVNLANVALRRLSKVAFAGARSNITVISPEELDTAKRTIARPPLFESSLEDQMSIQLKVFPKLQAPWLFVLLTEEIIHLNGLKTEGIFRIPPDQHAVMQTRQLCEEWHHQIHVFADMNMQINWESFLETRSTELLSCAGRDIHVLGTLFKMWLREMPDPLIPVTLYSRCLSVCDDASAVLATIGTIRCRLHQSVLAQVVTFLQKFIEPECCSISLMDAKNLATVFAPNLLRSHLATTNQWAMIEETHRQMLFMHTLIVNYPRELNQVTPMPRLV